MKQTRRAQRMETRNRRKGAGGGSMNLVSLMDIFTILVFFLLAQSAAVEVLPNTDKLVLPESLADEKARETVLIMVTAEDILVNGQSAMKTPDALQASDLTALQGALEAQADRVMNVGEGDEEDRGEVTIMADKSLPYSLLKKVMLACTKAQYGLLSFAVLQKDQSNVNLGEQP